MAYDLSPRQRRKRSQSRKGVLLIGGSLLAIVTIVSVILTGGRPMVDERMCPLDSDLLPGRFVIVLDATDEFNVVQKVAVRRQLGELRARLPTFANVRVFLVQRADTALAQAKIDICNPGTGRDLSRWTDNPDIAQKRWEENYEEPLAALLDSLLSHSASPDSPIMETMQAAALSLPSASYDGGVRRELYLVSDMLQHGPEYTHYGSGPPSYEAFASSRAFQRLNIDLSGFSVTIFYLRRTDPGAENVQGRSHIEFWEQYFREMGASLNHVVSIDG